MPPAHYQKTDRFPPATDRTDPPHEVVIVGAGIAGLASAYQLANRGTTVTVYEQGDIGNGNTPLAAGGIRSQHTRQADIELMAHSIDVWEDFEDEFDHDINYHQAGYLMCIADPDQVDAMREVQEVQRHHGGFDNRLLDPDQATRHCPGLTTDRFDAVTYGPRDGYCDPHSALMGFKHAAEEAGATIKTQTPVTELIQNDDGTIIGIEHRFGHHLADVVVNAAGAWAPTLAATAGIDLPIQPKARRAAIVEPANMPDQQLPLVVNLDSGVYFRPLDDQQLLIGGHFETADTRPGGDDPTVRPAPKPGKAVSLNWQYEALTRAADTVAFVDEHTTVTDTYEGRYAMTPDENPIIEHSKPGLVTAAGFSGHGMMLAPATGHLVADLVCAGDSDLLSNADAYSRARFLADGDTDSNSESDDTAIAQF